MFFKNKPSIASCLTQITPSVFRGQAKTEAGEVVYLWMALITAQNAPYWRQYVGMTNYLTNKSGGLLAELPFLCHEKQQRYELKDHNVLSEACRILGYDKEELDVLIQTLGRKGLIDTQKQHLLSETGEGSHHISIFENENRYIVYATKTADFSITAIPLVSRESFTLKFYQAQYDALLMCVGSDLNAGAFFYNRGIFRSPLSVIAGDYKGISMLLHAFSAAVVKQFFPEKKQMRVNPVSSMQRIICRTLQRKDVAFHDGFVWDQVIENAKHYEVEHPMNEIKIDALVRYYLKSAIQPLFSVNAVEPRDVSHRPVHCVIS